MCTNEYATEKMLSDLDHEVVEIDMIKIVDAVENEILKFNERPGKVEFTNGLITARNLIIENLPDVAVKDLKLNQIPLS